MSWDTLFSLQGHGPYILGAYGVTFAVMAWEVLALWRRARRSGQRQEEVGGPDRDAGRTRR